MEPLDLKWIRAQFPALTQKINGQPAIFFDGLVVLKYRERYWMQSVII